MDKFDVSPTINFHFNWLTEPEDESHRVSRAQRAADIEPQLRHVALMAIQQKVEELQAEEKQEEVTVEETEKKASTKKRSHKKKATK